MLPNIRRNLTFVRFILQLVANFNILWDLWSFIIPEYVLYLYFKFFKGVHLKRAISSEQWTHELLKHEKFHSGKLSSIERIVMSNHTRYLRSHSNRKKYLNILAKVFLAILFETLGKNTCIVYFPHYAVNTKYLNKIQCIRSKILNG